MSTRTIRLTATTTLAALAATLTALGPPAPTHAANFVVDTLSDNPADGDTLREVISLANGTPGPDRITFAEGLTGTLTLTSGQLTTSGGLEIVGPGESLLTIDGGGSSRVLQANSGDLTLQGMTIANGAALGSGAGVAATGVESVSVRDVTFVGNEASNQGGGLWIANPTGDLIEIVDVMFDNNRSGNAGGGLYLDDLAGTGETRLVRVSFIENTSVNGNGGGAFVSTPGRSLIVDDIGAARNVATNANAGGLWLDGGSVTIEGLDALDNEAGASFGGATINSNTGDVEVRNAVFSGNTSTNIGAGNISSAAALELHESTVSENTSVGLAGLQIGSVGEARVELSTFRDNTGGTTGGLQVSSASFVLDRSTVDGNEGTNIGGVAAIGTGTFIDSSTFSNNLSGGATGTGGGLYVSGGVTVTVTDSTFVGNESREGGAIHGTGVATVRLHHTTMVDNFATSEGGGVYVGAGGDIDVRDSIVADNTSPSFPDVNDPTLDVDHSIVGNAMGIVVNPTASLFGVDPKLNSLADNGGPTLTMLPMLDSPAIDAANDMAIIVPPYDDQRGRLRPTDSPDMGAVEVVAGDFEVWTPIEPARFVDTRTTGITIDGVDAATGRFSAAEQRRITFAGRGDVPGDAVGVIANITAVGPTGKGFITAHPCTNPMPIAASLNYTAGVNLGNEIILGLDGDDACIFSSAAAHVTVDVVGYISADSPYRAVTPARYADTRSTGVTFDGIAQAGGAPGPVGEMTVPVAGRGAVPADAGAVVLYVAAVAPTGNGFVTVWDCDGNAPLASSLNFVPGVNRGNEIIADIGPGGDVCLFTSTSAHLTVDVVGYLPTGTNYESLDVSSRLLDTRPTGVSVDGAFVGGGVVGAGEMVELIVAGRAGIPNNVTTISVNVTAINPTAPGFVTVYDCTDMPLASSLNYVPGVNGGNEIIASVNPSGRLCLFTSQATDLAADVTGFTSP
jgi:hypothetical protein